MTIQEWDELWEKAYERALADGETPNKAVAIAYRVMAEQHGPRPGEVS